MWALSDPLLSTDWEKAKVAKLYIALMVYVEILITISVAVNIASLKNVK